ncbi:MAG: hypothetical protein QOJ99_2924, partial [Bryobacterales bacterium]|nr:hypothetical protein [Bryobacterales bacterium]
MKTRTAFEKSLTITVGLIGSLLCISTASATTIASGQANFNGTVTVNSGGVFFADNGMAPNFFNASFPNTGGFAGLTGGTIQNLTGAALTGAVPIPHFITFNVPGGPVFFDLMSIAQGLGTNDACASN